MSFLDQLPGELRDKILEITRSNPKSTSVFEALYNHLQIEDTQKRRKIEKPTLKGCHIVLQIPDLSVQSPIRKKLNLVFAVSSDGNKSMMALSKSIDSDPEVVIDDLSQENITFAALLPVPEKKNLRYLLIFTKKPTNDKNDPILIQYNQDSLTELLKPVLDASNMTLTMYLRRQCAIMGFELLDYYDFNAFKPFVVEAYQKSKEGLLYFLPNHVIFGFRKPILLFHAQAIESILYSSITRITFSITLVLQNGEKCEFSMIDQKEYEKIDRYVKTKDFRDNSMTEELKAKNKMKNNEHSGALLEAAKMVPGGGNIVGEESDDSEDENYQFGNESEGSGASDASDSSEESDRSDDEEEEGDE